MSERLDLWPIAIIEDRYGGVYSRGAWLAVACSDTRDRMNDVWDGPHADDVSAMNFWHDAPEWIAVGATPDAALAALYAKIPQVKREPLIDAIERQWTVARPEMIRKINEERPETPR